MRIEAYNQVQQLYQAQKVNKTQKASSVHRADQVHISSIGKDIQTAKPAGAASPDGREDLIAPINAKVQSGTYQVETGSFAEKRLQKYEEMR